MEREQHLPRGVFALAQPPHALKGPQTPRGDPLLPPLQAKLPGHVQPVGLQCNPLFTGALLYSQDLFQHFCLCTLFLN